jgi:hypothetical protein
MVASDMRAAMEIVEKIIGADLSNNRRDAQEMAK